MDFLHAFAAAFAAISCVFAYASLFVWLVIKAKETDKLRYKYAVSFWIVFTVSFVVAGLAAL